MNSLLRAALLSAALSLAACAWSVPADPGMNASIRRSTSVPDAQPTGLSSSTSVRSTARGAGPLDDGARDIYLRRCSQCHEPFSPRHATANEWPALVRKYGPRAGLFGEERERVVRYLQATAR
jgi:hypothetical protein